MIQRCNIHQRDVLHAVVAAQAVDQSVGGIHGGDAGDAELHGLAAKEKPQNFDLILTGDLGMVGKTLLLELLEKEGLQISRQHNDCGLMIFDINSQDVHAGGSGCGCSGSVFCSYVLQKMKNSELKRVLFIATGALMSPTSAQQGESIPGVAHLIELESE